MAKPVVKRVSGLAFKGLNQFLRPFGYKVERLDQISFFEPLLYRRLAKSPNFFFVQVGANDGVSSDPIREFVTRNQVAGLAVEPLKDIYQKLVQNYRDYPKVKPVNLALHRTAEFIEIHRVDPAKGSRLGEWVQGIGSIHPRHHERTGMAEEVMTTETVPCLTLTALLREHGVRHLDLLQIDTEGYDLEIIRMIDFNGIKPSIIRFEHGMPDGIMSAQDFKECAGLLLDQGYYVITEAYDAIAYQPSAV